MLVCACVCVVRIAALDDIGVESRDEDADVEGASSPTVSRKSRTGESTSSSSFGDSGAEVRYVQFVSIE